VQVKVDLEASKKPWRFRWDWIVSDIDFIESNKLQFWWQSYSQWRYLTWITVKRPWLHSTHLHLSHPWMN